jgi:arylsulfatase/arylsulfatase A
MLDPEERTLAELFANGGYRTGIFGKWHLGDSYPTRPCDHGFEESLIHLGGGLRQPSNIGMDGYFDPDLMHNGELVRREGYCTDIFTEAAIDWLQEEPSGGRPFLCVLSTNAPHSPFEIARDWWSKYDNGQLPEKWAKIYGMVENIDWNLGRLRQTIEAIGATDETIVLFVSDHGPCGSALVDGKDRFNRGLRGRKGQIYQGGLEVPCFWHWPKGSVGGGRDIDRVSNPIDVLPTMAGLCGLEVPEDRVIDGADFSPLLRGDAGSTETWSPRKIFVQHHRGDEPIRYRNYTVIAENEKLCGPGPEHAAEELFDLNADPGERHDLASQRSERIEELRDAYDNWFDDVCSTRVDNFAPPRIVIGTEHENPVVLNRNDWRIRIEERQWNEPEHDGFWLVRIAEAGKYDVTLWVPPFDSAAVVRLKIGDQLWKAHLQAGIEKVVFESLELPAGDVRIEAQNTCAGRVHGAAYVRVAMKRFPQTTDRERPVRNYFTAPRRG